MSESVVYFLRGLPASGKSTYAKQLLQKDGNAIRLNKDDIREMLAQKKYTFEGLFDINILAKMFYCDTICSKLDEKIKCSTAQYYYTFGPGHKWTFVDKCKEHLVSVFKKEKDFFAKIKNGSLSNIETLTLKIEDECMKLVVLSNKDIVLDDTNYNPKHLGRVKKYCSSYTIKIIDIHKELGVTLEQCLERNKKRDRVVPEFVIRKMAKQYNVFSENRSKNQRYETKNLIALFDVDGTLANIDHRLHFLKRGTNEKPDWTGFFEAMDKDIVRPEIKSMIDDVYPYHDIVLVTGRPEKYRAKTETWLKNNNIRYNALLMREDGDRRSDDITKQEILDLYIDKKLVDIVVDDRKKLWKCGGRMD